MQKVSATGTVKENRSGDAKKGTSVSNTAKKEEKAYNCKKS